MKKQTKRGLLGAASTLMAATLLAGCGGATASTAATSSGGADASQATTAEDARYPITITMFTADGTQAPADNKIYKLIEKELGVTFAFEYSAGNDDDRYGIMIASGEYPDMVCSNTDIIDAGGAVDLADKIQNYPNIMNLIGENLNKLRYRDTDHIYNLWDDGTIMGDNMVTEYSGTGFFIQKDVLADAGYPTIKTLDQYFDLIKNYQAKNPEINGIKTVGYTVLMDGWRQFGLVNPPYFLDGHPNDGSCLMDPATNTASDGTTADISKKYYQKLCEINAEGLLDPESCVMNYDQYIAKLSAGNVLGFSDQNWHVTGVKEALESQGMPEHTYVSIPLTYDESTKDWYMDRQVLVNGWQINTSCKDPDRVLTFIDDLCTEKWQKIMNWGIEGEDYMVDENGRFYRTEEQRKNAADPAWQLQNTAYTLWRHMPKWEGTYPDGNAWQPAVQPEEYYASLSDYDKDFLSKYGFQTFAEFFSTPPENPVYYPCWSISIESGTPASLAQTKEGDVKKVWLPQLIKCKPDQFDGLWDQYVQEYNACDPDVVVAELQRQVDLRVKNWS